MQLFNPLDALCDRETELLREAATTAALL